MASAKNTGIGHTLKPFHPVMAKTWPELLCSNGLLPRFRHDGLAPSHIIEKQSFIAHSQPLAAAHLVFLIQVAATFQVSAHRDWFGFAGLLVGCRFVVLSFCRFAP